MKVFCYDRCTTCKKALKWLDEKKVKYDLVDIKGDHPDKKIIESAYKMSGLPLKRFFNTSGQLYRSMELSKKLKDMSDDEQLDLLASDGMLVKRPFVIGEDFVLLGFKEEEWAERLKK
ncbi:MAG: arsenate reductase family protein [Lachnospiraceae bacterium]|nr:arsenate reductase family protein [Lachnospiraceae bacterium]